MSMKIEFYIPEDDIRAGGAADYLARSMAAIGFSRGVTLAMPEPRAEQAAAQAVAQVGETAKAVEADVSEVSEKATDEPAPPRERGKPAPGRARRTKAEIEEDEAADAADQAGEARRLADEGAKQFEEDRKAAISTGDERVSPEDAAAAEQDAADEAADPANAPAAEATREDVRAAMLAYGNKMGMDRLTVDLLAILKDKFSDGKVTKLSEIPEDAAAFQSVIDALTAKMEG